MKCRACRGEGIRPGPTGPRVCARCAGIGLRALAPMTKECPCGASYDAASWSALEFVGEQDDGVELLELRNCDACGSTLGVLVTERSVA